MVPHYGKEKGNKATVGLCCKLGIRGDHCSANSANGGITPTNFTVKTFDIFKYLDFGFYYKVCFEDNYILSPSETWMGLCISHWTGRLMCYHILTQTGKFISIFTVQRVTNL